MKQKMYKFLAILVLLGSFATGWLWMDFKGFMNSQVVLPVAGINIEIGEGASLASVSKKLYERGIISSVLYPRLAGKLYPELTRIKRGEYHLERSYTPFDIFKKISSGEVIIYQIQFIEGWTFNEYLFKLASEPKLRQDVAKYKNSQLINELQITHSNLEGWFYPDTYNYQKGTSDLQILKVSHNLMKQKLNQYWQERDIGLPYDEPYQVLIMASLIEKETGHNGEREKIAGVFVRRLNKNMRLQTDPTVIYGMGENFDGDIRRKDLLKDTPYNTYRRKGLPPTPIAMPSEASLSAAVHPSEGTELYFVARGDGSHQFSTTLEEHNKAVRLYQLNQSN